jgi:hypothetical protein
LACGIVLHLSVIVGMVRNSPANQAKCKAKAAARSSAALAALSPTVPLFDQADDAEAQQGALAGRGKKRTRNIDEIVAKCLRDNFPGFKQSQTTMLLNKDGKSLTEILRSDREKVDLRAKDAPVIGKHYYSQLRSEFAYSDAPEKRLKVADDKQKIHEDLLAALEDMNKHPRSFDRAADFLDSAPMVNQKSLVLLFKQALVFSASAGPDVIGFLMGVLKYCARHAVERNFPHEWGFVKSHMDDTLVKSLSNWKGANMKAKLWWEVNRSFLRAILPIEDTDQCMAVLEDYQKVERQLCNVVQSSAIGNKLFGAAHRQYQGSKMSTAIKVAVAELTMQNVTMQNVLDKRKQFIEQATQNGKDVKESMPKRTIEVQYRGCTFPIVVHSFFDEYLMVEAVALEGAAVEAKTLPALFCENELVPADRPLPKITVDLAVVNTAVNVRRAALAAVISDSPAGEVILNCLLANQGQFLQLHRAFRVTLGFWSSVVGQGSEKRLQTEVVKCLSGDARRCTLDQAIERMELLGRSKLLSFCGLGLQSLFASCKAFLGDIKAKRMPKYDGNNDSEFLKCIMGKVSGFYCFQPAAGSGGPSPMIFGQLAVKAKLEQLRKDSADKDPISLGDLTLLKVYGWILTDTEMKFVDDLVNECISSDIVGAADRAVGAADRAVAKVKAGRKKVNPSARDAVLSLLG